MTTNAITPPLKWHGGKHYLARRIVALMPRHLHYVEAYAGGLAVLLERDPEDPRLWLGTKAHERGVSEVVNDLNGDLMTFWRVLQSPDTFERFRRVTEATPFSEPGWEDARRWLVEQQGEDPVDRAYWFFVVCRQSLAGRMDGFAPLSHTRTRRKMNEQASAWLTAVEGLPAVHARLKRVTILNRPALEVIRGQNGKDTLFYLDPPYYHGTRVSTDTYREYEMTETDHRELLDLIRECTGKVMLSGYANDLYDTALAGWTRHTFEIANHAAGGKTKRTMTEVLWCNF